MVPMCERVLEIVTKTFIKEARDGCIIGQLDFLDGYYNHVESYRRIFEIVVSNFDICQLIALRRLIVCVADRALYNWFHLLQSTDEIQLLITPEGTQEPLNFTTCAPHLPHCLFSSVGWIAKCSSLGSPYTGAEKALSLLDDCEKAPTAPLQLPPLPDFPDPKIEWYGRTAHQQAAMDKFGFWLMRVVRDKTIDEWLSLLAGQEPNPADVWLAMQARSMPEGWAERLQQARQLEEDIVFDMMLDTVDILLHSFLYDIDALSEYAIVVKTPLGQVDDLTREPMLVSLPAELFGDEGWIARFSRYPRASVDRDAG